MIVVIVSILAVLIGFAMISTRNDNLVTFGTVSMIVGLTAIQYVLYFS